MDALEVLGILRESAVPVALIHDEYGNFEGLVTPADVLEAIAGVFRSDTSSEPHATEREDGSWLLAGAMPADEMADRLGIRLPQPRRYSTVAGFLLDRLERLPRSGERIETDGWCFEIIDLDGRRIDKILATRVASRRFMGPRGPR
jgi:putative hemolysin